MSRDFRHGLKQTAKSGFKSRTKNEEIDSRYIKVPTKQQRETNLRLAVRHRDHDAFEDYDEPDL